MIRPALEILTQSSGVHGGANVYVTGATVAWLPALTVQKRREAGGFSPACLIVPLVT